MGEFYPQIGMKFNIYQDRIEFIGILLSLLFLQCLGKTKIIPLKVHSIQTHTKIHIHILVIQISDKISFWLMAIIIRELNATS